MGDAAPATSLTEAWSLDVGTSEFHLITEALAYRLELVDCNIYDARSLVFPAHKANAAPLARRGIA